MLVSERQACHPLSVQYLWDFCMTGSLFQSLWAAWHSSTLQNLRLWRRWWLGRVDFSLGSLSQICVWPNWSSQPYQSQTHSWETGALTLDTGDTKIESWLRSSYRTELYWSPPLWQPQHCLTWLHLQRCSLNKSVEETELKLILCLWFHHFFQSDDILKQKHSTKPLISDVICNTSLKIDIYSIESEIIN